MSKANDLQQLLWCEVFYHKNHQKRERQRYHDMIYGSAIVRKEHRKIRNIKCNGQILSEMGQWIYIASYRIER